MISSVRFERIVELLQEAAIGHAEWSEAARLLTRISGTEGCGLGLFSGHSQLDAEWFYATIHFRGQVRQDLVRSYFDDYWPDDERVSRVTHLRHGRIVSTGDVYTEGEKRLSRTYNEALRDLEAQNGLHIRLDGPAESHVVWQLTDSIKPGGWGSDQVATIGRLRPHVRQFVVVRQALADAGALGASLGEMLESTRFGLIQLGRGGRIVEVNDHARTLLREGDRLMDREGELRVPEPAENAALSRLLARALPPFGAPGAAGSMILGHSSSRGSLALHVNPVGQSQSPSRATRVAALVLVVDPAAPPRIDPRLVESVLGLTPTESRLAVALAAGQSLRDVALSTGSTEQTVRWHMKQIFRKQGISRQVELVRRVLGLRGVPASHE